ncbi:MAG TPA: hypothetical protein VM470_02450 [Acidimicrobiia bacterium]|nr:hypothetical protein [Acidimicrobiia bacterium]
MKPARSLEFVRVAAVAYTAAFLVGTLVSIRKGYVAEPLGIRTGNSVRRDVLRGNGAALAAPWNMIVQMWVAVAMSRRSGRKGRRGSAWLAFLGAAFVAGSVAEPVSHKVIARELPILETAIAVANIVFPGAILAGALASLVDGEGS